MKKLTVKVYDQYTYRKMEEIRLATGKSYSAQVREGLRMLFREFGKMKEEKEDESFASQNSF